MSNLEESKAQEDPKMNTSDKVIHQTIPGEDDLLVSHSFASTIKPEKSVFLFRMDNFETIVKFRRIISTPVYTLPNTEFQFLLEVKLQEDGYVSLLINSVLDKLTIIDLTICLSILSETKAKLATNWFNKNTWAPLESHELQKFVTTEELVRDKCKFLPNGTLTILCEVVRYQSIENFQEESYNPHLEVYNNIIFSDCKIVVAGTTFNVHKAVIAAQSEYFKKFFADPGVKADEKKTVKLDGVRLDVFKEVLKFIYTGNITKYFLENKVSEFSRVAETYQIGSLISLCIVTRSSKYA